MPPLPSTPSDIYPSITRRLDDIDTFQIPRLAKCAGPISLRRELAEETKGDLEQVRRNIEICKEIGETMRPREREETRTVCHAFEERFKVLQVEYRRAIISSKRLLVSSSKERHLLQSRNQDEYELNEAGPSQPASSSMQEDALQTRTNEVTDALRRTTQTMQAELERSVLSVQMLEDSTKTLRSTTNLYDTYTSLLETSGALIKQLEKADWYDRLIILAAFLFFLLCVGWIIKRRILDRVVGGVGWWVGGSFKLLGMGLGFGRGGKSGAVRAGEGKVVGAGKVGSSKEGLGRVGLAGARENPGAVKAEVVSNPILDSVVPPAPSGDSAVVSPNPPVPGQDPTIVIPVPVAVCRDEL